LVVEGRYTPLPPGIDLAVYRIVQEALTNVHKHAPKAHTTVRIDYRDTTLDVHVDNHLTTHLTANGPPGHGLIGMRERVTVFGGTLLANQTAPDRFTVHASLPMHDSAQR
jgi:signal transduction histidine kinase